MAKFITLNMTNGEAIHINADHILAITNNPTGGYVKGSKIKLVNEVITVQQSNDQILKLIA